MQRETGQAEFSPAKRRFVTTLKHLVQPGQNLPIHRVAGGIVNRPVIGPIGGAVWLSCIHHSQQRLAQPGNFGLLGQGRLHCRLAHRVVFQTTAHFQQTQQCLAFEPDHRRHRPLRRLHPGRQIGAIAPAAADDAQPFPAVQRLADGGPAYTQLGGQRHLGRQSVADL